MTFSLHQGGVVMLSQIAHAQSSDIHPLARRLGICSLISIIVLFLQFTPSASCNGIAALFNDKPPQLGRAVRKNAEQGKNGRIKLI